MSPLDDRPTTTMTAIDIRLARESDLPQLIALSDAVEQAAHWTRQQWLDIFHSQTPQRLAWIAEAAELSKAPPINRAPLDSLQLDSWSRKAALQSGN